MNERNEEKKRNEKLKKKIEKIRENKKVIKKWKQGGEVLPPTCTQYTNIN